ncbi:MAG: hypothetical protein ACHQ03_01605 [Candidatus Bathyarchaeia archaeon]
MDDVKDTVQSTSTAETPELSVETLQKHSSYLIDECIRIWKTYKEVGKSKFSKISAACKIHAMIVDLLKLDPDLSELTEMRDTLHRYIQSDKEIREELETARRTSTSNSKPTKNTS